MEADDAQILLSRIQDLETWFKLVSTGSVLMLIVIVLTLIIAVRPPSLAAREATSKPQDIARVRQLYVVDQKGTPRVVIGAPAPDPQVNGQLHKRRSPAYGILYNNASGDEIGGTGALEDGTMTFCFDYYDKPRPGERLCLVQWPNGSAGFQLFDQARRPRLRIGISETGSPSAELLDEQGRAIFRVPEEKKQPTAK